MLQEEIPHRFGLTGSFRAKKGKANELASILLEASETINHAKGCLLYVISQDIEDRHIIWVNEVWETEEDHDNSLDLEEVQSLIARAIPLLDGKPERGVHLRILGGYGLPS